MNIFNGDLGSLQNNTISVICLTKDKGEIDFERIEQIYPKLLEIKHPNIIHYYSIVGNENQVVILMEKIQMNTLRNFLLVKPNRMLPEEEIKPIFTQLVSAIECLHNNNITHPNINLENIFYDEMKNEVKLGDLLIYNKISPLLRKTSANDLSDFFFYAPEIWFNDQFYKPSIESDIWCLGVILYIMACGRYPFFGRDRYEIYMSVRNGHLNFPNHLSKECQHLITTLMELDPRQRATISSIKSHVWFNTTGISNLFSNSPFISFYKKLSYIEKDLELNQQQNIQQQNIQQQNIQQQNIQQQNIQQQNIQQQNIQQQNIQQQNIQQNIQQQQFINTKLKMNDFQTNIPFRKRSWSKDFVVNNLIENFMKQKEQYLDEEFDTSILGRFNTKVKRSMSFSIETNSSSSSPSFTKNNNTNISDNSNENGRRHSMYDFSLEKKNPELSALFQRIKSEPPLRARDFLKTNIRPRRHKTGGNSKYKTKKQSFQNSNSTSTNNKSNNSNNNLKNQLTQDDSSLPPLSFQPELEELNFQIDESDGLLTNSSFSNFLDLSNEDFNFIDSSNILNELI